MKRELNTLENLAHAIQESNLFFLDQAKKQVNAALTLRNWIIGHYIFEYEQSGQDRAEYGEKIYKKLAERLHLMDVKGFSFTNLHLYKRFYLAYPQIVQTLPEEFQLSDYQSNKIVQTLSEQFKGIPLIPSKELLSKLSFSHFIELIKCQTPLKQVFYETECIKNNWSVRELRRAMNSMLYERTGLSKDKKAVLESMNHNRDLKPENIFRNPYMLEFLGLDEKSSYSETALEEAIINHLQKFLIELGRGFCFESRQRRITFDNAHYRIDLVFYHRILKCHVLIDLKLRDFVAGDAGQMNLYLNYYKDNEMHENDNPPIGIILCAGKGETVVKYATGGMSENLFVSQYLTDLPTETQLKRIIDEEQSKRE
jgi:predicted nuclease of restriction endonuclease-like (RecB) superfamily